VPVVKGAKVHTSVKDVKISYDFKWQRLHWMSLQSCYRRSAYFEYYEDDFARFYEDRIEYLCDYNEQLLRMLLSMTKIKTELNFTDEYLPAYPGMADYRLSFSAKKNNDIEQKLTFRFLKNVKVFNELEHC
jgi:hypothetical protein